MIIIRKIVFMPTHMMSPATSWSVCRLIPHGPDAGLFVVRVEPRGGVGDEGANDAGRQGLHEEVEALQRRRELRRFRPGAHQRPVEEESGEQEEHVLQRCAAARC